MRRFVAALALLAAAPLHAQDEPAWVGVWDGRIGNQPVRACFESWGDGPGHGSYYYLRYLEPISLSEADGEGGWIERAPGSDDEALWEFAELSGERMRGTWRHGNRSVSFDLNPVAWSEGEWGGPCSSAAFIEPRLGGGEVATRGTDILGWRYAIRTYLPPAHFDEVSIEAFAFAPTEPGDAAIGAVLAGFLPRETVDDDFVQCLTGAISALGTDGYYELTVRPGAVSRGFLGFEVTSSTYCGGAHPNYYTVDRTFDRQTGEEIDLFDWLGEARIDGEDSVISDELRAEVLSRWPADSGDECRQLAEETEYWSLGLDALGLIFRPDLPHVATACEEPIVVPWDRLEPYLDAEGRTARVRLLGG